MPNELNSFSPSGAVFTQPSGFGISVLGYYQAPGNSTTLQTFNLATPTVVGTATARNVAATNVFTATRRLGYVSAGTAGAFADVYQGAAQYLRGNNVAPGGFQFYFRGGTSDAATVAGARGFIGMLASVSALTNVEPTTFVDCVGFAQLSTSANWNLVYNDASGTASSIDLGSNFPANTLSTDLYEFIIQCNPSANSIYCAAYRVNQDVGGTAPLDRSRYFWETTITTDLPTAGTFLAPRVFRGNNATALAVGVDVATLAVGTQY